MEKQIIGWLQIPVYFYSGFWVAWTILRSIDTFVFQNAFKEIYFLPSFIGISITSCWMGFKDYVTSQTKVTGFSGSVIKQKQQHSNPEVVKKILSLMDSQKPYLLPELDLTKLSELLNISPKMVSHLINNELKINFYEFVNKYRVEEFKSRAQHESSDKLSLLGLAYECGFNSKSTFNHVFKKSTGQTPSEYYFQFKNKSERKHSDFR